MSITPHATASAHWLAVYTAPRSEKITNHRLQLAGIETYCPLNMVYRKWSDRTKKVEEPLFKSYVFVKVTEAERQMVRQTPGVLNFVYWCGKPAIIKPQDIATIRRFLNEYDAVELESLASDAATPILPGAQVMVQSGLMMGKEGTALRVGKNMVEVRLESLGFTLIAKIERKKLSVKSKTRA
ncbi:MAG: UpxY family transcription antiterminator [Bacteroidetes bacterium]|nr:MAG: UpxY family transcription antiterminator [Bacteroidota bacterium]